MKASEQTSDDKDLLVVLGVSTLSYLRRLLEVVLIVKYVASEKEAYWLLLKDFKNQPGNDQESIKLQIPRANKLSENPWPTIEDHVRLVYYRKLNANTPGHPD